MSAVLGLATFNKWTFKYWEESKTIKPEVIPFEITNLQKTHI